MLRFTIRRLLISIPLLLVASVLVFTVIHLTIDPTAAVASNPRLSVQDIQHYRHDLGLDRSGPAQYFAWLGNFVRGNWGTSLFSGISVTSQIREALVNSMVLGVTGFTLALLLGVIIGVIAAVRQYSVFDYLATSGAFVALSVPVFWFALIMQLVFGLYLTRWLHLTSPIFYTAGLALPGSVGFNLVDRLRHLTLPAIVLAVHGQAVHRRDEQRGLLHRLALGHADYGLRDPVQPGRRPALRRARPKDPLCLTGPPTTPPPQSSARCRPGPSPSPALAPRRRWSCRRSAWRSTASPRRRSPGGASAATSS